MKDIKCIVCEGPLQSSKLEGLVECKSCGFISTDLELTEEQIKKLYSSGYYNGEEYADYIEDKQLLQNNFLRRLNKLKKYLNNTEEKKLFEIGCAYGFFLEVAKRYFDSVSGIDISDDAVDYAVNKLGLDAYAGDYINHHSEQKYDVICMWDTIEHLERPDLYVEKAHSCLNRDGIICITTGDIGSLNARARGRKWRQIHPPTHLHYFSKRSIKLFLERRGFEVLNISYPANSISVNTILYTILCLKSKHEKLYKFFKKMGVTKWSININLHDFMYVIAKKVDK